MAPPSPKNAPSAPASEPTEAEAEIPALLIPPQDDKPYFWLENNTERSLLLQATESLPRGRVCEPGMNRITREYWQELLDLEVETAPAPKGTKKPRPATRFPAREQLLELFTPRWMDFADGRRMQTPQITLYRADHNPNGEGATPPASLAQVHPKLAKPLIQRVGDRAILKSWSEDKMLPSEVLQEVRSRLEQLSR